MYLRLWKDAVVIPFPKTSCQKNFSLTEPKLAVMKTFEKLVRPERGVEDAAVTLINVLFKHPEGTGKHARLLFIFYTNMCRSSRVDRTVLNYADDSVIANLLHDNETSMVRSSINS